MEDIICLKCGSENDYYTELKSNNNVARCNRCDAFIKNIPYNKEAVLYFGKFKGTKVNDIEDSQYLKWVLEKVKLTLSIRTAINTRLTQIENLAR